MHMQTTQQRALDLLTKREQARRSLLKFTEFTFPRFAASDHHREMCEVADAVAKGKIKRLLVSAPPRHTKTELFLRRLVALYFGRNPSDQVVIASYSTDLINLTSREIKDIMLSERYRELFPDVKVGAGLDQVQTWMTNHGGKFKASSVRGPLTGYGFDLGIIDDPVKDMQEAESKTYRDAVWYWYKSVFETRQMPGAAIIVTQTRWHADDLTGRIIERDGDKWHHLKLPAINDVGEALWPEWWPIETLEEIRSNRSSREWEALYQGSPVSESGNIYKREHFPRFRLAPDGIDFNGQHYTFAALRCMQAIDFAFTAKEQNDATVIGTAHILPTGHLAITNMQVFREEAHGVDARILAQYHEWKPMIIGLEAVGAQLRAVQQIQAIGLPITKLEPDRDKVARAWSVMAHVEQGRVLLPEQAPWLKSFEDELFAFPVAAHDDQTDVFTYLVDMFFGGLYAPAIGLGGVRTNSNPPHSASLADAQVRTDQPQSFAARKAAERQKRARNPFKSTKP